MKFKRRVQHNTWRQLGASLGALLGHKNYPYGSPQGITLSCSRKYVANPIPRACRIPPQSLRVTLGWPMLSCSAYSMFRFWAGSRAFQVRFSVFFILYFPRFLFWVSFFFSFSLPFLFFLCLFHFAKSFQIRDHFFKTLIYFEITNISWIHFLKLPIFYLKSWLFS